MQTDIEKYRYELSRYNTLKNNISQIVFLLEKATIYYEEINKSLSKIYLIDYDNTIVYNKSIELKNKIDDTSKKLKNFILPRINSKIYSLRSSINNYEEGYEEE